MLTSFPPQYLYEQYADDEDIQALVQAFNNYVQAYLNVFNALNLPIWTNAYLTGAVLDWVITGIYGIARPATKEPSATPYYVGPYDTWTYNSIPYNARADIAPASIVPVNDDFYRRVATWILYKADGFQFTTKWLKRRIARFLYGTNGIDPVVQQTYDVGVSFSGANITITIPSAITAASTFKKLMDNNALPVPFQYTFQVILS